MRKLLLIALCLIGISLSKAQVSQTENELQKKYWNYRDRYKKHFTKIGREQGESVPISLWYKTQNCGDFQGGQIKMGDAMAMHGDYMCLLATEYYLTKKQGGDLTAIKNEIYYALKAVERVDLFAEQYLSNNPNAGQLNGFVLRDDVPLDFYKNWQVTDNVQFIDANRSNGFLWDSTFEISSPVYYAYPPVPGDSVWLSGSGRYFFKKTDNIANYKPSGLQNIDISKLAFGSYRILIDMGTIRSLKSLIVK